MTPIVLDRAVPGCDCYVLQLPPVNNDTVRSWSYQGSMRSFQWSDGGVVKTRNAFSAHRDTDAFFAMLEEGASNGVYRPSSYSTFFHSRYRSPRPTGPARRAMRWIVPGGWESLLMNRGEYDGTWYRYDLRSAYLWALFAGLPDPATYRYTDNLLPNVQGCYLAECYPTDGAPYPYDRGGVWPITTEEIERYNVRCRIRYGITWSMMLPAQPMIDVILKWSFWKEVGRAYWGRWAATAPLECATYRNAKAVKRWQMPSQFANPIWAHLILARVRARLHEATTNARVVRVYVDNVITDRELPTGDTPGCWRHEATYHNGIVVSNLHRITERKAKLYAAA